jgi:hypothetical protein
MDDCNHRIERLLIKSNTSQNEMIQHSIWITTITSQLYSIIQSINQVINWTSSSIVVILIYTDSQQSHTHLCTLSSISTITTLCIQFLVCDVILVCHFNKSIKGERNHFQSHWNFDYSLSDWTNLTILMKIEIKTVEVIERLREFQWSQLLNMRDFTSLSTHEMWSVHSLSEWISSLLFTQSETQH